MKGFIKRILKFFSFIKPIDNLVFKWGIVGRVKFGMRFLNWIVQRIFRVNSEVPFPVNYTSRVIGFKNIKLHKDFNTVGSFSLSTGCYIQALSGIEIGENFLFAPGLRLISVNHGVNSEFKSEDTKPIKIGDNVWFGANVVILPEVEIGSNCVVGAGSVVTKSFPDNSVIVGNPAKVIRTIPPKENG